MKKWVLGIVLGLALGAGVGVYAKQGDTLGYDYLVTDLNDVALNAAAGSRTFTIDNLVGMAHVQFFFDFDYTANAGIISLTCTGGPSKSARDFTLTVCDSASTEGECSAKTAGILKSEGSLSADTKWEQKLGVRGLDSLSCVVAHGGAPGVTDTITVQHRALTF